MLSSSPSILTLDTAQSHTLTATYREHYSVSCAQPSTSSVAAAPVRTAAHTALAPFSLVGELLISGTETVSHGALAILWLATFIGYEARFLHKKICKKRKTINLNCILLPSPPPKVVRLLSVLMTTIKLYFSHTGEKYISLNNRSRF